ncbi:retrovirus-related pol polyprotein from transposon TNT 1-94 [Tanacetum coccineum]
MLVYVYQLILVYALLYATYHSTGSSEADQVDLEFGIALHIGLRESRKLKHGALSLYIGNGMHAAVEVIGSFDLILPNDLIIVLDNCHFAPSLTRGVVSISRLDGIYEIDMHNLYLNVSSMFNVSNKRVKYSLDSSYLWHCLLCHINKKRMNKLQHDGILQPTHDESLEKCKSYISGKMARGARDAYSEQTHIMDFPDNEITSDSNIILYSQYLQESQDASIQDTKTSFWFKHSNYNPDTPVKSHTPVRIEAPSELPKVSLVTKSLKKLKYHPASFDKVVKKTTTSDAISVDEITEVQTVFNQMEAAVDQCFVDKNAFEIQIKQLSIDNDQLLKQIMSQEIVHIAVNSVDILNVNKSCVDECNKCLKLETELLKKKDLIEKDVYDKLTKSYSTLEKLCISLELTTQLQEIFQKDNFCENQNALTFNQLFEINELKAQSQEKDTVIRKLKGRIKSLSEKDSVENVKKDIYEIKTINIELEHNLNAQLQEKVFAIAALKNELRKLKGKNVVDTSISKPIATIAPGMFKLDIEPISHRLKNNRDAHEELLVYVSKTCPSFMKPYEKLVAVTPMKKDKKVRFVEPVTSSSNNPKHIDSLKTKDSNKPLLTSTGVNTTTSASGSKPSGNTKKNRITRPPSSNQQNKVEGHPRKVKSSFVEK